MGSRRSGAGGEVRLAGTPAPGNGGGEQDGGRECAEAAGGCLRSPFFLCRSTRGLGKPPRAAAAGGGAARAQGCGRGPGGRGARRSPSLGAFSSVEVGVGGSRPAPAHVPRASLVPELEPHVTRAPPQSPSSRSGRARPRTRPRSPAGPRPSSGASCRGVRGGGPALAAVLPSGPAVIAQEPRLERVRVLCCFEAC